MLFYTEDAVDDIVRIREYLDGITNRGGETPLKELVDRLGSLMEFPQLGTLTRYVDVTAEIRDWVVGRFVVRYLIELPDVFILRIWLQNENRSRY